MGALVAVVADAGGDEFELPAPSPWVQAARREDTLTVINYGPTVEIVQVADVSFELAPFEWRMLPR